MVFAIFWILAAIFLLLVIFEKKLVALEDKYDEQKKIDEAHYEVHQRAMKLLCDDLTEAKKQLIEKDADIKSLKGFNEMQLNLIADFCKETADLKKKTQAPHR